MLRSMVVLVAAAGLSTGACGSGGTRLTRAEFVKQGNAICKATTDRSDAAGKKAFPNADQSPPSAGALAAFARDTAIPEFEKQIKAIDDLSPPKDAQAKVDAALTEARSVLAKIKANPALLLNDADTTLAKANELIGAAGLDVCAK